MVEPILGNPLLKKFSDLGICLLSPPLTHKKQDFLGGLNSWNDFAFVSPNFSPTKLCFYHSFHQVVRRDPEKPRNKGPSNRMVLLANLRISSTIRFSSPQNPRLGSTRWGRGAFTCWNWRALVSVNYPPLKVTASLPPENRPIAPKGNESYGPTIHFQVLLLLVSGRVHLRCLKMYLYKAFICWNNRHGFDSSGKTWSTFGVEWCCLQIYWKSRNAPCHTMANDSASAASERMRKIRLVKRPSFFHLKNNTWLQGVFVCIISDDAHPKEKLNLKICIPKWHQRDVFGSSAYSTG